MALLRSAIDRRPSTALQMASKHVNASMMIDVVACCPPVLQGPLSKKDADELASAFKALADPARLRLLSFIAAQPDGEACVCHVIGPAGLSQPTVSHHLKLLHHAGLLEREKRGTWVYYRVVRERLDAIRAALTTRAPRPRSARRA